LLKKKDNLPLLTSRIRFLNKVDEYHMFNEEDEEV